MVCLVLRRLCEASDVFSFWKVESIFQSCLGSNCLVLYGAAFGTNKAAFINASIVWVSYSAVEYWI